jgi:CHAT domain/Carbohydrate family 9 binding domain-like
VSARRYENFDLLVESLADGTFRSRVAASPVGAGASATFAMPFDATELENLLLKLDPGRSQMRRASADPRPKASVELGGRLFDAAFGEEVLLAWSRSQDATREAGEGLRLRLQLTDAPVIAGLPWELLYDRRSNTFPAQSERTPVVRYLEVVQPPRPLAVEGPLRILAVLSSPTDLPELDVEAEWRRMQDLLAPRVDSGAVHLDRLPDPTTGELASWLRSHDTHVLHVIGHGDYDETQQEGVLYFCDQYGRSVPVPAGVLGPYLHDHDPLRLVFLNACQSGRLGAADPFSGMAGRLVQQDCTAVVAMQFPVSDGAATAFTGEFYAALTDGMPVDQAVTSARKGLLAGYASEWATPVLYLNAPDGQVFESVAMSAPEPEVDPPVTRRIPETSRIPESVPPPGSPPPTRPHRRGRLIGLAAIAAAVVTVIAVAISRTGSDGSTDAGAGVAPPASSVSTAPASASAAASAPAGAVPSVATATVSYRPVEGPQVTARRLATPPTIDGRGEDWPATAPVVADFLVAGNTATVKGLWSLGWDPDNLYLLVQVVDPELTTTNAQNLARLFQGDAVTLQFGSPGANADGINLSPGDVSLSLGPNGSGGAVSALTLGSGPTFDVDAGRAAPLVKAGAVAGAGGYTVEAAVPWSVIRMSQVPGPTPPAAGTQFGATLLVDDADPASGSQTGIRSRVSNNRYVSDHTPNDGGYRRYWGLLTLGS